jgi:hypothetical protein
LLINQFVFNFMQRNATQRNTTQRNATLRNLLSNATYLSSVHLCNAKVYIEKK